MDRRRSDGRRASTPGILMGEVGQVDEAGTREHVLDLGAAEAGAQELARSSQLSVGPRGEIGVPALACHRHIAAFDVVQHGFAESGARCNQRDVAVDAWLSRLAASAVRSAPARARRVPWLRDRSAAARARCRVASASSEAFDLPFDVGHLSRLVDDRPGHAKSGGGDAQAASWLLRREGIDDRWQSGKAVVENSRTSTARGRLVRTSKRPMSVFVPPMSPARIMDARRSSSSLRTIVN